MWGVPLHWRHVERLKRPIDVNNVTDVTQGNTVGVREEVGVRDTTSLKTLTTFARRISYSRFYFRWGNVDFPS